MNEQDQIECVCGWSGLYEQLVCSEAEAASDLPANQCTYNICPQCGAAGQTEAIDDDA